LKGIHRGGEFPVAVVRKTYEARGYDCMVSAQSKQGIPYICSNGFLAFGASETVHISE
jgi:hypothetical protein